MRWSMFVPLLALVGPAAPAAPPASETVIRAIVRDLHRETHDVSARKVRHGLKRVDIDGDGRPDYLFSKEALGPGWCGSGGCWMQLWLDRTPRRPIKIFDGQVREAGFRAAGRGKIVDFDLHGSACHTFGAHECPASFRWDAKLGRLVETASPRGTGVVRFIRPIETVDGAPPPVVAAASRAAIARCVTSGGTANDADQPLTVPDIDGDGIRDWVVPELFCDVPDSGVTSKPSMSIFASAGNALGPVLAASAPRLEVDAATRPASVYVVDLTSCDAEALQPQTCRRERLIWARQRKQLLPRRRAAPPM